MKFCTISHSIQKQNLKRMHIFFFHPEFKWPNIVGIQTGEIFGKKDTKAKYQVVAKYLLHLKLISIEIDLRIATFKLLASRSFGYFSTKSIIAKGW